MIAMAGGPRVWTSGAADHANGNKVALHRPAHAVCSKHRSTLVRVINNQYSALVMYHCSVTYVCDSLTSKRITGVSGVPTIGSSLINPSTGLLKLVDALSGMRSRRPGCRGGDNVRARECSLDTNFDTL